MANLVKTYHLTPTFDIAPPPNGPVALGSVVASIFKLKAPLNRDNLIAVPDNVIDKSELQSTRHVVKRLKASKFGLFSKLANMVGLGVEANAELENDSEIEYTFEKEHTISFEPTDKDVEEAVKVTGVQEYLKVNNHKKPIFLVTGLKTVEGVKIKSWSKSGKGGRAGVGVDLAPIGVPVDVGLRVNCSLTVEVSHDAGGSTPFVFCIRLKKIWWEEGKGMASDDYNKGAFLGTSGSPEAQKQLLRTKDTTVHDVDDSETVTMTNDKDEEWECIYSVG